MRLHEEGVRVLISAALVAFLAAFTIHLWLVDLLSSQQEFGAFLSAELVAFAMLVYISTKPNYDEVKKSWMLIGCIILAVIFIAPLFVSGGQP